MFCFYVFELVPVVFFLKRGGIESRVMDSESIRSGNVLVQSIHPRPVTPSAGDHKARL